MTHPTDADVEAVARAMKERAAQPLANLESLDRILVGSLGDVWKWLARAALFALPHYIRAVEEREGLIKALDGLMRRLDEHFGGTDLSRDWQEQEEARAALAKALEP